MLQRVIRDPGGNSLIRVIPELCGPGPSMGRWSGHTGPGAMN